jgi:hypothetical protein
MIYIANGFSPSMLKLPADVEFKEVSKDEFCGTVSRGINAIGHAGTIDLINKLCGTALAVNRISITAAVGDEIHITMLITRLEEGKVLNTDEIQRMYNEGKVRLVKAKVYGAVLAELSDCQGVCDEVTYDTLSYKAKTVRSDKI